MNTAPRLPDAPPTYSQSFFNSINRVLTLYFGQLSAITILRGSSMNLNISTLPTDADIATLREGDVYRDTTAGNVLKIKV